MKSRALPFSSLLLSFLADVSIAEARAKGTSSFNGKTVSTEFASENSASATSRMINDTATIKANVDGAVPRIEISAQKLTWNKRSFNLNDSKQVEIFMGNGTFSIKVDGKEILPKK